MSTLATSHPRVLLLGAGFVVKPALDVLTDAKIDVTVGMYRELTVQCDLSQECLLTNLPFQACRTLESATRLCEHVRATPTSLDVTDSRALDTEVAKVDLVVSLIPYTFHTAVIRSAIRKKKNVVTTSYVSAAMLELEQEAKEAGITVMNEIGLDPGIDHLYAVKTINEVHKAGGKIVSFLSYCGGLPAPEVSDNPLGYKFSWSSRGVLLALMNSAKYYKDGEIEEITGPQLMGSAKPYSIYPGFAFVAYPNRDSTEYKERYNIPEARTIIRGTLRYQGFPEFIHVLVDIGFLNEDEKGFLKPSGDPLSWKEVTKLILGGKSAAEEDLIRTICLKTSFVDNTEKDRIIGGLRWIGLFSDDLVVPHSTPLGTLCSRLEEKMQYGPGERDMVMLQHKFEIEHTDGTKETRTSTLVEYGDPEGYSAMARLVGIPCGVAVKLVLDGRISGKGILAPMNTEINGPLITELKKYGIECKEQIVV